MRIIRKFIRIVDRVIEWSGSYMMLIMVLIVFWQVFGRYVMHKTPSWSEEIALLLMMYSGFLSIAIGFRHELHIRISMVTDRLPKFIQMITEVLAHFMIIGFGFLLVYEGYKFTLLTWSNTLPATKLPTGLQYLIIPITGIATVIYGLDRLIDGKEKSL